jgi:hypothetical protein
LAAGVEPLLAADIEWLSACIERDRLDAVAAGVALDGFYRNAVDRDGVGSAFDAPAPLPRCERTGRDEHTNRRPVKADESGGRGVGGDADEFEEAVGSQLLGGAIVSRMRSARSASGDVATKRGPPRLGEVSWS